MALDLCMPVLSPNLVQNSPFNLLEQAALRMRPKACIQAKHRPASVGAAKILPYFHSERWPPL